MPRVRRTGVPPAVLNHLLDRIAARRIDAAALQSLAAWLDRNPEVPEGAWFHRLEHLTVCGRGDLVLTLLEPTQVAKGEEVE